MTGEKQAGERQDRARARQNAFLAAYVISASVKASALAAGVKRTRHYEWLRNDPDYGLRFIEARQQAADELEGSAAERAMVGVFEPNVFQGKFVYPQEEYVVKEAVLGPRGRVIESEVRGWRDVPGARPFGIWKRSEMLHALLLRGFKPERYRQTAQFELTGAGGAPIAITDKRLAKLSDDELATLKHLHARITEADDSRTEMTESE